MILGCRPSSHPGVFIAACEAIECVREKAAGAEQKIILDAARSSFSK